MLFFYEHGEKAGRLLAHQIKSQSLSQQIKQIRSSSGKLRVTPSVINETFQKFYDEWCASPFPTDDTDMIRFLDGLEFPSLTPSRMSEMDQPLKQSEIEDSIKLMQSGKASGPDGFPKDFYKKNLLRNYFPSSHWSINISTIKTR